MVKYMLHRPNIFFWLSCYAKREKKQLVNKKHYRPPNVTFLRETHTVSTKIKIRPGTKGR